MPTTETLLTPRQRLDRDGFVRLKAEELGPAALVSRATRRLLEACAVLPPDPYCEGGFRFRQYARLFYLPWADRIFAGPAEISATHAQPVQSYQQPAALNSEEAGELRRFPAIPGRVLASDWLRRIIRFDLGQLTFAQSELAGPIQIGVHLVELRPRWGVLATASPNRVHRDGEPYTCAHLVERRGVIGGENHIIDPEWADQEFGNVPRTAIRAEFMLERPLDGYIVRDDRVAHHVAAVEIDPAAATGSRSILLIDFTPMRPWMLLDSVV